MKKLSFVLVLFISILFLSCSSTSSTSNPSSSIEENNSSEDVAHTFYVQGLFYNGTFDLPKYKSLYVEVSAYGYVCTKCGEKYHANELYSCYIDGRNMGSNLKSILTAEYLNMGYTRGQVSMLVSSKCREVESDLYLYYCNLGYEKTSCDKTCINNF